MRVPLFYFIYTLIKIYSHPSLLVVYLFFLFFRFFEFFLFFFILLQEQVHIQVMIQFTDIYNTRSQDTHIYVYVCVEFVYVSRSLSCIYVPVTSSAAVPNKSTCGPLRVVGPGRSLDHAPGITATRTRPSSHHLPRGLLYTTPLTLSFSLSHFIQLTNDTF